MWLWFLFFQNLSMLSSSLLSFFLFIVTMFWSVYFFFTLYDFSDFSYVGTWLWQQKLRNSCTILTVFWWFLEVNWFAEIRLILELKFGEDRLDKGSMLDASILDDPCRDILLSYGFKPIQDGPFWGCSPMGGGKKARLPKICHTSYNNETWHSYNLPKEDPKSKWISRHTSWVLLTSTFFHWKSAKFAISRNTDVDCILLCMSSNSFNFFRLFKYYFNRHSYNFVNVSKNGYFRPS